MTYKSSDFEIIIMMKGVLLLWLLASVIIERCRWLAITCNGSLVSSASPSVDVRSLLPHRSSNLYSLYDWRQKSRSLYIMKENLHSDYIRGTAFVWLLVYDAPGSYSVAHVATAVFDLGVVTHNARKCGGFVIRPGVTGRNQFGFVFEVEEVKNRENGWGKNDSRYHQSLKTQRILVASKDFHRPALGRQDTSFPSSRTTETCRRHKKAKKKPMSVNNARHQVAQRLVVPTAYPNHPPRSHYWCDIHR